MFRPSRAFLAASVLASALASALACAGPPAGGFQRVELAGPAMGTEFRVVLYASDAEEGRRAAAAALARVRELDRALSDYDPASELSLLGAASDDGPMAAPVGLSPELTFVLARAQEVARTTGGAFDVTVGPLTRLWRRAGRQGRAPDAAHLAAARAAVGHAGLELDEGAHRVRLLVPGMRLDLGGIAKGYALDEVLRVLREHGIERALVDGGGDVAAGGAPPGRRGWSVAVTGLDEHDPRRGTIAGVLELAHAAVATSGDLERGIELDGRRYSHVLDPRTGLPFPEGRLASVLAPSGLEADAWATVLCVLDPEEGLALLPAGLEAAVTHARDGRRVTRRSAGFESALSSAPAASGPTATPSTPRERP